MSGHSKWANIKHRKAKQDAQRGKVFTKLGKELVVAAKQGGGDPEVNPKLKMMIQKCREANMPMENINRNIAKATGELAGVNYEEIVYEGYGPAGVAVLLQVTTDNRNRTVGELRHLFSKHGGNLGEAGCVAWMFESKGLITLNQEDLTVDSDELMLIVLDAGAEDMKEEGDTIEIITAVEDLFSVKDALVEQGFKPEIAELTMIPKTTVAIEGDDALKMLKLMDLLEDHDDVQAAYANFDISDEQMELLG